MKKEMEREAVTSLIPKTEQSRSDSLDTLDWPLTGNWIFQLIIQFIRLKAQYDALCIRNEELEAENKRLFELANLGSDTSGIPSSKDWKKNGGAEGQTADSNASQDEDDKDHSETPTSVTGYISNRGKEKKQHGGQEKHAPTFLRIDNAQEREPVLHYPEKCTSCPRFEQCMNEGRFRKYNTSHEYNIEVIRVHRKHMQFEATSCFHDGQKIREEFPGVIGTQFYGTDVQLNVLTWHHIFHGSYDRIALAGKELLGLSLGAGTANAIVQRVSAKILGSGFMDALRFFILLFEIVLGVDETSACVCGRNAWVHTAVTPNVTLLTAHWRRGYEGMIYAGVLQFYIYTLISDCWTAYFKENFKYQHTVCNGHILRELVAAAYFRQQCWAIEMFDLLLEILEAKRDAVEQKKKEFPEGYVNDIRTRYRQIVANGFHEIKGETKGKSFSLLERLKKLEDASLAFAIDFNVEFTNNTSEQSLRNLKVALRVIGQFRTLPGLADYCIIQSFMDTCRKQGHNPFDMLRVVLSGGDIIEAVFDAEKSEQLKRMIRLTDAFAEGDANRIRSIKAEIPLTQLTEELLAAVSHGRFKVYNDPPPEKKKTSPAVPRDKMQAARENNAKKKNAQATADPTLDLSEGNGEDLQKNKKRKARASPNSA